MILSIPAVQTALGNYATNRLNEDFGTDIHIGKVGLQFNGDVELKEVLVRDYTKDTLFGANEINTSIINFKNVMDSKLAFGDIDVYGLVFNLKTYKGEVETNLDRFVALFDEDPPSEEPSHFLMSSSDVSIYDGVFRLIDENKETPEILEFTNIGINTTNFLINGSNVSMRINQLTCDDSRGLHIDNLISDFTYTPFNILLENLSIKTTNSELEGEVKFLYNREDLAYFTDKVQVDATFEKADIALNELNHFYNEFGINQRAKLSAKISGTLNDMQVRDLRATTSSRSKIYGDINFKNLFNAAADNFYMNGDFTNLTSNYRDLKALLPNVLGEAIPSSFDRLGDFRIEGQTEITSTMVKADVEILTDLGLIVSDLELQKINDIDNASYIGNVVFDEFDLGVFVEDRSLGVTSFNLDIDGKGFTRENLNTHIDGEIFNLNYNNYSYKKVAVAGDLTSDFYNGSLVSRDENLNLEFNGLISFQEKSNSYDFVADVQYANLKALNFAKNDSISIFKGYIDMQMNGYGINDAEGVIYFSNTVYKNETDEYVFNDFEISSRFNGQERVITVNSPDIIQGKLSGVFVFEEIPKLFKNAIGSNYSNFKPYKVKPNQHIDFNFNIYNKIIEVFIPDLNLGKDTFIKGRVESNQEEFQLVFKSPEIKLFDYFAEGLELQLDNKNPIYNAYIEVDSLNTKYYNLSEFSLINKTFRDTLHIRTEFKGGQNNRDEYNINFYHTINEENRSVIGFKHSDVTFRNNKWIINKENNNLNRFEFDHDFKEFQVDRLKMVHEEEEIMLTGSSKDSTFKDIQLHFKDVYLSHITPEVEDLSLEGKVNGSLDIDQIKGKYLPSSSITVDDLVVNEMFLGAFNANIVGNEDLSKYNVHVTIKDDIKKTFEIIGVINSDQRDTSMELDLIFNKFKLDLLNPFLDDVINNIRGEVTGTAIARGSLSDPDFFGDLILNKGGMNIVELNTDFQFADQSEVTLAKQSFMFNSLDVTDSVYQTKGKIDGSISHTNFSDWRLDLAISSDNLLVLNTEAKEDALYYGTAFIDGSATIKGPSDELVIDVIAETNPGTVFVIPLSETETIGDNSYIHFLSPEEKAAKLKGEEFIARDVKGLELDFDLDITRDAEIEIVIDPVSKSTIRGRGEGALLIDINTNGKFNMYGDFVVIDGVYNFRYGGVVQKTFNVLEGNLIWEGDPLDARVDIKALYKTRANPSPLLDNPINRSIDVNLVTALSGKLERPDINFDFQFPNVNSTVKSELNYRLEAKEERDNQALFLLATGSFSSRGANVNFTGTFAERLNGIVNNILSSDGGKLNVGVNYEAGQVTPEYQSDDRVGLTLQTNISDRIVLNSKVGVPVGGAEQSVIAGDVQIDFLLNEEGTLTATVFNRENSIRNLGEEIGYTQGLGITYSVDFDTFRELLQKIFTGKVKTPKVEEEKKEEEIQDNEVLPDYMGFKKDNDE
ncbi:translocation/assembly module TamB [Mangrovimonas sp. AS39]|uniref:translocation/assembly module TamB domain-containing protein n=1 Tax=Mangrovimonas futianensis TaxID=2895523 RepID=UPI001E65B24D|nr:translocation/assembly module TamB domain-containing protein [Mangrovimonas futianensis]MCF1191819.1 translocation/assembly module TamB [Mangrovimonas futianensis]MCF1195293.1 translocation/assembly module TamB [Mangrovimonas futianensis]